MTAQNMALPFPICCDRLEVVREAYSHVGARLVGLLSGPWRDRIEHIAALPCAPATEDSDVSLPIEIRDPIGYAYGCRLLRSVDYCLTHGIDMDEILEEMGRGDDAQKDHAESHLFVLAQLSCAAKSRAPTMTVASVRREPRLGVRTPDLRVGGIGVEIRARRAGTSAGDVRGLLQILFEAVEHAAEKTGGKFPHVVAYQDFGPQDLGSAGETLMVIQSAGADAMRAEVASMLTGHPEVPALVIVTSTVEFQVPDASGLDETSFPKGLRVRRGGVDRAVLRPTFQSIVYERDDARSQPETRLVSTAFAP
jgi:hypothetical protein